MRTTLNLNEELLNKAMKATGIERKTELIHLGLEALVRDSSRERLIKLEGYYSKAKAPKRDRSNQ